MFETEKSGPLGACRSDPGRVGVPSQNLLGFSTKRTSKPNVFGRIPTNLVPPATERIRDQSTNGIPKDPFGETRTDPTRPWQRKREADQSPIHEGHSDLDTACHRVAVIVPQQRGKKRRVECLKQGTRQPVHLLEPGMGLVLVEGVLSQGGTRLTREALQAANRRRQREPQSNSDSMSQPLPQRNRCG